jgi:ClpX C4-type zinc finger protein
MLRHRRLACSFCGKKETEVAKLVVGPRNYLFRRVYICNGCVGIASRIMAVADAPGTTASPARNG